MGRWAGSCYSVINFVLQASPESDRKRANVTCLVYSYDGNGMQCKLYMYTYLR